MFSPGLVYDASDLDWLGYLEGLGVGTGTDVPAIDPSGYNSPSIAIGRLLGSQTVTRSVTAVTPGRYRATINVPGVKATVRLSILNFGAAGETKQFKVTFTQDTAASGVSSTGNLTPTGGGATVRSPIAVTPQGALAPAEVTGSGASGKVTFSVTPGFAKFPITAYGLAAGPIQPGSVTTSTGTGRPGEGLPDPGGRRDEGPAVHGEDGQSAVHSGHGVGQGGRGRQSVDRGHLGPAFGGRPAQPADYVDGHLPGRGDHTRRRGRDDVPLPEPGKPLDVTASWAGVNAGTRYAGYVEYPHGVGTVVTIN